MKKTFFNAVLPIAALVIGLILAALQWLLFATAVDSRGLVIVGSPVNITVIALSAAAFVLYVLLARKCDTFIGVDYPAWMITAAQILAALGIALLCTATLQRDLLSKLILGLCGVAMIGLLVGAFYPRLRSFGAVPVSLFFAVHCVLRYRMYSSDPQLQNYVFPLLAEITLMLCFYHYAAVRQGKDAPVLRNLWRLCGITVCGAAITRGGAPFALMLPWLLIMRGDENE